MPERRLCRSPDLTPHILPPKALTKEPYSFALLPRFAYGSNDHGARATPKNVSRVRHDVFLSPTLSQREREMWSALRATFIVKGAPQIGNPFPTQTWLISAPRTPPRMR
jgi:hypothetical protein